MPELAEVEFFRKRWQHAAGGETVRRVRVHERARLFRGPGAAAVRRALTGRRLRHSQAAAKQMLFRFSGGVWLGIHLGMSGELTVAAPDRTPGRHDHLVLVTARHALVLTDPRMFGRVDLHEGPAPPDWWTNLAPPILSRRFTVPAVAAFLRRHAGAPVKAVLLLQERFPGVGNWMADEILWRAAIHPRQPAGSLDSAAVRRLWRECRRVCRLALGTIAGKGSVPPPELNRDIPDRWLFNHRWKAGGLCPLTKEPLARGTVGGRTTCWSPARQKLRRT